MLPGISSPDESAANLHIRGGTPDQNLVLYDGIKIYHQGHLFGNISPFNPYIVESVNVFKSGAKAEYGNRISGIIDIESMKEIPSEFSGGIGANFLHADGFIKTALKKDKLGLLISARSSLNDLINLTTYNSLTDKIFQNSKIEETNNEVADDEATILNNSFNFTDINYKLIFKPNSKNNMSFSGLWVDNNLNYASRSIDDDLSKDNLTLNNNGLNLQWESILSDKTVFSSSVNYSKYSSNYSFQNSLNNTIDEQKISSNSVKDFGFLSSVNHRLNEKSKINIGYEFSNLNLNYSLQFSEDDSISDSEQSKLSSHSLFSELEFKENNFYIRGGIRSSYFSNISKFFIEPRLYAEYKLNESFSLKSSAEIKNQAISQLVSFEFNELGFGNSVWVLANNDGIPTLSNKQFTFGIFYQKNGWKFDVESYVKDISGLTSFTKGFSANQLNLDYASGNSSIFGIDVLIKKKIKNFRTWLSYTYSTNNFYFPDLQPTKFPGTFDQRHVLSWANTYKYKRFQASIGWQFATGKPYSIATGIDIDELVYNEQNNGRLANYHKLDLSAFYDFYFSSKKKVKSRIGLSFINIYDNDNQIDTNFDIDPNVNGNNRIVQQFNLGLTATPNFVFRVYF